MSMPFAIALLLAFSSAAFGSEPLDLTNGAWPAHWIDVPGSPPQDYGVYHFRRSFDVSAKPAHFVIYASGDNRFQLLVNGSRVAWGPARGDLYHWRYETVDIAPFLIEGKNVLAAVVWNDGPERAVAQITNQTGFLLQSADAQNSGVDTGRSWKCLHDTAYTPQLLPKDQRTGYYALGPNETVDGRLYPWHWEQPDFDDSAWPQAHEITPGAPRDQGNSPNRWMLVPSSVPLEEQKGQRLLSVRQADGATAVDAFLKGTSPVTIPAHTKAALLLDGSYLTTAYPELLVSGGKGAAVKLHYAEALFDKTRGPHGALLKANRDEVEGKHFFGPADTFIADGGSHRLYRPLFWRTYRYVRLEIQTEDQPLTLEDFRGTFTAYPFERRAEFEVSDTAANSELARIFTTGWRTARLCAHETYMDCPFYEQLQYGGDARIQMLISIYMTGDGRLMKNGISLLNSSRTAEGATYSRAPSNLEQYIPPFSLWWIGMVHDYWMYLDDPNFVKQMLPGVHAVLSFYAGFQGPNGSLRHMPWWNFVDWVKQWSAGEPPSEADGGSSTVLDLQLLMAYRWASSLEKSLGSQALGEEYAAAAKKLEQTVQSADWDSQYGLFADQPSHRTYSQQANTLAVLAHVVPPGQERAVVEKMFARPNGGGGIELAQSSIYFRAYTNATLREVGLGGRYVDSLGPWREMLANGLTTWAECNDRDTRSDCHAWGASPNFELLRTVAGIDSAAPGFKKVRIAPNQGRFSEVSARMPHPRGTIEVKLKTGNSLTGEITLPDGTEGELVWAGQTYPLHPGSNRIATH